jgi:hypothetical protein
MFSPPAGPHGGPNNQIPEQICAQRSLLNIYMFSFYFWSPSLARKMGKTNMRYYPNIRHGPGIPF